MDFMVYLQIHIGILFGATRVMVQTKSKHPCFSHSFMTSYKCLMWGWSWNRVLGELCLPWVLLLVEDLEDWLLPALSPVEKTGSDDDLVTHSVL